MAVNGVDAARCAENFANDRKTGVLKADKGLEGQDIWTVNANELSKTSPNHAPTTLEDVADRYCLDSSQVFKFKGGENSQDATDKVMSGKYFFANNWD